MSYSGNYLKFLVLFFLSLPQMDTVFTKYMFSNKGYS